MVMLYGAVWWCWLGSATCFFFRKKNRILLRLFNNILIKMQRRRFFSSQKAFQRSNSSGCSSSWLRLHNFAVNTWMIVFCHCIFLPNFTVRFLFSSSSSLFVHFNFAIGMKFVLRTQFLHYCNDANWYDWYIWFDHFRPSSISSIRLCFDLHTLFIPSQNRQPTSINLRFLLNCCDHKKQM